MADQEQKKITYIRVCSDHFVSGAHSKTYDKDYPDWAPSLKLGHKLTLKKAEKRPDSDMPEDGGDEFYGISVQTNLGYC